jgi:hypothetical protein
VAVGIGPASGTASLRAINCQHCLRVISAPGRTATPTPWKWSWYPKELAYRPTHRPNSKAVADELNNHPCQTLGWLKPTDVFNELLVEAGGALTT